MNRTIITKQLDDWQVLPRPQQLSELYFTDIQRLPRAVTSGTLQKMAFTVHNLEHQTTIYRYKLAAVSDNGMSQSLGNGVITLGHDHSQAIDRTVTLPSVTGRMALRVEVEYTRRAIGEETSAMKRQSIQCWVKVRRSAS
jgi:hypothetical protein